MWFEVREEERSGMGRCESVVGLSELGDIHRARPRETVTEGRVKCVGMGTGQGGGGDEGSDSENDQVVVSSWGR